jgi:hypothetical protein
MKKINCRQMSRPQVSPASLLGVSVGYCQTALVDESGMTEARMWKAQ